MQPADDDTESADIDVDPDFDEVDLPPEQQTLPARQVLPGVSASLMVDNHRVALVFACETYAMSSALFSYLAEQIEKGELKILEDIP